ncbi:MAG: GNAT family N-acetyltransferase [Burkholderiaceae bacterium]
MDVRPATPADAHAIAQIHVRTWQEAYARIVPADYLAALAVDKREAYWRASIVAGTPCVLVCCDGSEMLGWIAFAASRDAGAAPTTAEVWAFYVAAQHWGRGVGRALWHATHARLQRDGYREVGLWAFPENERAGRFYRTIGFEAQPDTAKQFELGGAMLNEIRYARAIDAAAS